MKKLVLIDDAPWRTQESLKKLKGAGIEIEKVFFFTAEENVPGEYEKLNSQLEEALDVQVDRIGTGGSDFYNKLNPYYERDDIAILIDFRLEEENTFEERINVQYANNKPDKGRGKIWFYTTGGAELKSMLVRNFGDQLIDVISFSEGQIVWDTDEILDIVN